jgi:serine/threonine protein kinase/tetratricopeptide (TPR) repeat protein
MSDPFPPQTHLNHFEIIQFLGAGGMGHVYQAMDRRLGRCIALKVVSPHLLSDPGAVARFEREARAASALNHPNIVTIHEIGTATGPDEKAVHYLVMEFVDGETFRSMLQRGPSTEESLAVLVKVAHALARAHAAGIVHRDIKPENIMINSDRVPKVVDFGLAKLLPTGDEGPQKATEARVTDGGVLVGTTNYMSPEQIQGNVVGTASDVFSFGCLLFEALSGTRPFDGSSKIETLHNIVYAPARQLVISGCRAPDDLLLVIGQCLEKHASKRAAMKEVARSLEVLLAADQNQRSLVSDPRSVAHRTFHETSLAIGSIAVLPITHEADSDLQYLAEALTEETINRIARETSRLRVIARTTSYMAASRESDPQKIGSLVSVDAVLVGRLRRFGDFVRLSAEMLLVSDASVVFGVTVNARSGDLVSLENEMVGKIVQEFHRKVEHSSGPQRSPRAISAAAYDAFIKGRFHWWRRTEKDLHQSIAFFERAIASEPTFALAFAGLANCYTVMHYYGNIDRREAGRKAREFAVRARSLDASLPDAYTALGGVHLYHEWDFANAEEHFTTAIRLDPSQVAALHWYGDMLNILGRTDDAIAILDQGLEIDPLSMSLLDTRADSLLAARNLDAAIAAYQRTLEVDDSSPSTLYWYGIALEAQGDLDQAEIAFSRANAIAPHIEYTSALAHVRAVKGDRHSADGLLAGSSEFGQFNSPVHSALLRAALGESDRAIDDLERGLDNRSGRMLYLMVDPRFDMFHSDERFQRITRTVGIR